MGRWLALLSTVALIIATAAIDPCKRQPFRGRCPSVGGQPPKRSQFVLRYYARNGECVSYPYGHCASDESEPQLYRYKEECEDSCINNTPENLGQPKEENPNQTYATVSPLKETPTISSAEQKDTSPEKEETTTKKETTVTAPTTTVTTTESTTSTTTTERVTTVEKVTTTEEATTTPTITPPTTTETVTTVSTTHATTQSVVEPIHEEEEVEEEEEENSVDNEEEIQTTTTVAATTTRAQTTSAARTECERRREASSSSKIRGGFVPVCDSNGNFQKVQCEPDGRQCFCVNSSGIEITNSRTRNGVHPDCARIETATIPKTQTCTGRSDRGPCSSAYTRFYFDEATQKCSTFSYSGCGGNGNNYETEIECVRRCVPKTVTTPAFVSPVTQANDICSLPKERGPCDKYELRFYYNSDTKECKYFFWGGCEGNGNNFETAEACQSACGVGKVSQHNIPRTFAQSSGPIKTIPGVRIGNGTVPPATHEEIEDFTEAPITAAPTTRPTTRFVPQTTRTSAPTQTTQRVVPTSTAAPVPPPSTAAPVPPPRPSPTQFVVLPGDVDDADSANRCSHPLDSGSCRGQFVRWFWDNKKSACDVFTYSGCEGNGNNFASREECLAICNRDAPTPPPTTPDFSNVCKHEIDSGECTGVFQRFAFDTDKGECRPFTYGGCGGNGNNFATMPECQIKCEKAQTQPVNVCDFEIEAGECTGVFPRFAYDHESNDCRSFTYGGCGGNGNNFATINECRNVCVKRSCSPVSQCDLGRCQVVNDNRGCPFCSCSPPKLPLPNTQCLPLDTARCQEPCIVINNRRGCQECACPHLPSTVVPPVEIEARPPGTIQQTARPPATPVRVAPPASPARPPLTIPGIPENKAPLPPAFNEELQEKCLQPMESGPCKNFVDRWFFNKEDGSCHPFKYGGCAGNRNHFFTQRECEIHCARFLHPLAPNELTTSTDSHEHDARVSSQELTGTRSRLSQQRVLAFDLPSIIRGQQSLQVEPNALPLPETYETQRPIRIDQRNQQEHFTTAETRAPSLEYTTEEILVPRRSSTPKELPVEGYTETSYTTQESTNTPSSLTLQPIKLEKQTVEPRPVIKTVPKKGTIRQEAAPTQTRGSGSLLAQNTYSMHAVTNYDPQGNSNLEGLSPPVDPTYFTYNSQHLGKRKQFAVNNVPFDKNTPNQIGFIPLANRPQVIQTDAERRFETALAHEPHDEETTISGGVEGTFTGPNQKFSGVTHSTSASPNVPQLRQQLNQQPFFQQRVFVPQQSTFANTPQSIFNRPTPAATQFTPQASGSNIHQLIQSNTRSDTVRTHDIRGSQSAAQQTTTSIPVVPQQASRVLNTSQGTPQLTRVSSDHLRDDRFSFSASDQLKSNTDSFESIRTSHRNTVANNVPSTHFSRVQQHVEESQPSTRFQGSRVESEKLSSQQTTRNVPQQITTKQQQVTTEVPRLTSIRHTVDRNVQSNSFIEPIRQVFQPVQNAVKTVVTQDKLPLNILPIHKIENTTPMVPKRIFFREGEPNEPVPIVHGIRSGPYGQTHWVYYDGDYYGPLIPGIKVNRTDLDKIDATVTVKENSETRHAYESFKSQAVDFQRSLNAFIKQKEAEQQKREREAASTTRAPIRRHPQGVVVIPIDRKTEDLEEALLIPVDKTENTRFKSANTISEDKLTNLKLTDKGAETDIIDFPKFLQPPPGSNQLNAAVINPVDILTNAPYDNFQRHVQANSSILLGEVSEEEIEEEETPRKKVVAAGVSQVRVVEPLPVQNYQSPEPPLRGPHGKKYLEPATTQGVKIITSTARPSTTTTTPITTTTTTTAITQNSKIEETVEEEADEEEEPEEVTTTTAAPTTTEKEVEVVKELPTVQEELARLTADVNIELQKEQQSKASLPENTDEEEDEEPEEIPEPTTANSVPTSRATRLIETTTENTAETEEIEEEEPNKGVNTRTEPEEASVPKLVTVASTQIVSQESTTASTAVEITVVPSTEKPEVETTLVNEISSMEGEEGAEENEIIPTMMNSSKFAVHRETEEVHRFEEVTSDFKAVSALSNDESSHPTLKKVEITPRPTTATTPIALTEAPTTEAATRTASTSTQPTTTVAETTPVGTVQTSAQNIEFTDSTTAASRTASTAASTTPTTTKARPTTTESDLSEEGPDFDENQIKKEVRVAGVPQITIPPVDPNNGIGRQPIPNVPVGLPDEMPEINLKDLEEPTTIFPTARATSVRNITPHAPSTHTLSIQSTSAQAKGFDSQDPRIICAMPADAGFCENYIGRWFFNSQTGQCEQFSYGGCAGNMNNFVNRTLCELSCMTAHPGLVSQVPERCSYDKDAGFGKGYNVKWYFNMRNLRCEQFVYEGKGGNTNQFETLSDCERICSPQPTRPTSAPRQTLPTISTIASTQPTITRAATVATQTAAVPSRDTSKASPLVPLPKQVTDEDDTEYDEDNEEENTLAPPLATRGPIPPSSVNILPEVPANPPGTEPKPPAFASKTNVQSVIDAQSVNSAHLSTTSKSSAAPTVTTQPPEASTYKAESINMSNLKIDQSNLNLPLVGPSMKGDVNYQTGRVNKAEGITNFEEGRLPPPDIADIKNEDDKVVRPSCPNGNRELRYSDGRPVMCLPGKRQCPDKSVCYFNGMDYFCCPNEDDPYDRHIFGGYGGDEARYGYKVFGPLRIRRLMDEIPLRAKRQTSMDRAFSTNPVSFNLDSVVAPLRFDAEKPRHVSSASRMRKPIPPKHGNPMCILPLIKGDCQAAHLRYYYDRKSDSCRLFYYSGCQGNANNFGSLEDCQRLCVLGGQTAPAVQSDAVTPATIVSPGQCPTGSPLGGSLPVLCGNSTESIGCPIGYYCRGGPPDICCPGVDPEAKSVQQGVKVFQETTPTPGVPRNYQKEQLISTPKYMCPDASDPLMAENGAPAVCGAGFDGVKMCPKGYYCAIDGAKGSRLCCPLFGSTASKIPTESVFAPTLKSRPPNSGEIIDRGSLPSDQKKYDLEQQQPEELSRSTPAPVKNTEAPQDEEEEEEYEDNDDTQKLRLKPDSRNTRLQEDAATHSPKAADLSQESVNIDVPKEEPVEEPVQPTEAPAKPVQDKSVCHLKPTEGRACREDEKAPRTNLHYFYSAKDRRCKLYFYRGCGGSENRFEKKADCETLCLNA